MILLVSYDLKSPMQNYTKLYETLKTANSWWHYLESTWLIKTSLNPKDWFNKISQFIDKNDRLLIIEIAPNYQGWLPKEAWDWININK